MTHHGMKTPESRMMGNYHVRFGGGSSEKQVKLLVGGLPYHVAHSPGELHIALDRMWQSLWANVEDEISRAQGNGSTGGFFGLPPVEVEELTATSAAPVQEVSSPNGHFDKLSAGRVTAAHRRW